MNKKSLLALTLLTALPFAASATEGLSYNYVEGGYVNSNRDSNLDSDGWNLNGSAAISDNFHVFGGYTAEKTNDFDIDVDHSRVGLGYNRPIAGNTDLLARVAYENTKISAGSVHNHQDGYSVEVGVRSALAPRFEGYALAGYEDAKKADGDFYGRVGAQVKLNQNWGISGDVKVSNDETQYFIGPRMTF